MLISLKLTSPIPIKTEPDEESQQEENKVPELHFDDFDSCAGCKASFKPPPPIPIPVSEETPCGSGDGEESTLTPMSTERTETEDNPRRGQQPRTEPIGSLKKVKEFYSFNVVTGELLHVTAFQALLAVFELRLLKSAPGINLQEANENLGFCQNCATHISQLYKLHQEVTGLVQSGSVLSRLMEYEDLLTDNQETDFSNPKKRRRTLRPPSKVNGVTTMEDMDHDGGSSWTGGDDLDTSWNNDDYSHDDDSYSYENEVNVKPTINSRGGIKITSVGSTNSIVSEDDDESPRKRRSTSRNVDYAKVLQGPHIEGIDDDNGDDDWNSSSRIKSSAVARKKTAAPPPSQTQNRPHRGRGRPPKNSKVVVPPPRVKDRDPAFKTPGAREAVCQICRKVFPSHLLAEHMNVAHNAVQGQPCLICGKFFESSYKAIKHLLTHVPEKAFGCSRCHDTFKTAEERNFHTSSHLDSDKKLQCPKCPQAFTSLLLLNKHEAQKHRQTKSFLCSICAKLLTGKDEWIQHILSHGPFQCYYCKVFLRPGDYKRHIQAHVQSQARPKPTAAAGSGVIAEVTLD